MVTSNVINRRQALHHQSESYKKENCNSPTVSMSKMDMQHELEINTLGFIWSQLLPWNNLAQWLSIFSVHQNHLVPHPEFHKMLVAQLCLTLCGPMDCNQPGSSVHGISQARVLEWVAIPFARGSSQPRNWTQVSCIAGRFFTIWATREAFLIHKSGVKLENLNF